MAWGLRSSATGKGPGLPVVIFGGEHSDLPLDEGAGEAIADVVIESDFSVILDLSMLRKKATVRFMAAFSERLYFRNRRPLHLILDEADEFAPQKPFEDGAERLLGAIEDIVRRGRARGIGVSLITQRAAVLNKNVLSQVETLVALRTISKHDRAAIEAWIEAHGTQAERDVVMSSLASLENGEAWVWSPSWLKILKRVKIRRRKTFDSSATPKVGELRIEPTAQAKIDLDAIKVRIAEVVKKAAEDDPKLLKKHVAELEKDLAAAKKTVPVVVDQATIERARQEGREQQRRITAESWKKFDEMFGAIQKDVDRVMEFRSKREVPTETAVGVERQARERSPFLSAPRVDHQKTTCQGESELDGSMQRVIDAMAWLRAAGVEGPWKRRRVAALSGYALGGTFASTLSRCAQAGLIFYPGSGEVDLTDLGLGSAGAIDAPTDAKEALRRVYERCDEPMRRCLNPLVDCYPKSMTRVELASIASYAIGGTFASTLSRLSTLGAIEYPNRGSVVAAPWLFLE